LEEEEEEKIFASPVPHNESKPVFFSVCCL